MKILINTPEIYRERILTALQNNDTYLLRCLKNGKDAKRLIFIDTLTDLKKYEATSLPTDCPIYSQIVSDELESKWVWNVIQGRPACAYNSRLTANEITAIYKKFLDKIQDV